MTKSPLQQILLKLKSEFPEAVTETERKDKDGNPYLSYGLKNEFIEQLKEAGLDIAEDQNRYELQFPGKQMAKAFAFTPCYKTLVADKEQSKNFDNTENVFIEGDNLDALRMLQNSYLGKVKMIYIDPPYNTGGDEFIYNDDFSIAQKEYLQKAGILDEDRIRQVSEMQNGLKGRFHAGWLAFMYPRLQLARELLSDDGVIFISIDDNEQANLKLICDEIFGEDNFAACITVVGNPRGRDYGGIARMHDYILSYKKSEKVEINELKNPNKEFPYEDENGGFEIRELRNRNIAFNVENRPNLHYPFYVNPQSEDENGFFEIDLEKHKDWIEVYPKESQNQKTVWRWGKEKSLRNLNTEILAKSMNNNKFQIVEKYRKISQMARSVWWNKEDNTEKGTLEVKKLFNGKVFNFPKSMEMIKKLIQIGTSGEGITLDFFAGSCTTAHAVMQLNAEDNGKRKFIMCNLSEKIDRKKDKEAYQFCTEELKRPATIAEIAKERIRRAGKEIKKSNNSVDTGFRAFVVEDSLLSKKEEQPIAETEQKGLEIYTIELKPENFEPLLYETLLKTGVTLDMRIFVEKIGDYPFAICDRRCYCVTENLTQQIAQTIAEKHGDKFDVFYYLSDALKPQNSFTEIEAAILTAPGDKQIKGLNFY